MVELFMQMKRHLLIALSDPITRQLTYSRVRWRRSVSLCWPIRLRRERLLRRPIGRRSYDFRLNHASRPLARHVGLARPSRLARKTLAGHGRRTTVRWRRRGRRRRLLFGLSASLLRLLTELFCPSLRGALKKLRDFISHRFAPISNVCSILSPNSSRLRSGRASRKRSSHIGIGLQIRNLVVVQDSEASRAKGFRNGLR